MKPHHTITQLKKEIEELEKEKIEIKQKLSFPQKCHVKDCLKLPTHYFSGRWNKGYCEMHLNKMIKQKLFPRFSV